MEQDVEKVRIDSNVPEKTEKNTKRETDAGNIEENDKIAANEQVDEDQDRYNCLFEYGGMAYSYKERPAMIEEREGKIEFRVVNNDGSKESFIILTGLKNIFQKQLPNMPREYIARLVYDRTHVSIAIIRKPMQVVGGIAYRPFEPRKFAEIVFCAISSNEQVRGYGAHLMNHLKDYVKNTSEIMHFLTYADNYAIGYFKKQGFTKEITLPKHIWMGYIKDYEGGTLMQCTMLRKIRYLEASKILLLQKAAIHKQMKKISRSHIVHKGIEAFRKAAPDNPVHIDPLSIPGIREAGWTPEMDALARRPKRKGHYAIIQHLLSELQNHPSSWPFMSPVSKEDVPDYYLLIKEPMDLGAMQNKLEKDLYDSMDGFIYDCKLIFDNCRKYNGETTTYYKNATKLEKFLQQKLHEFPEFEHLLE